jgi:type IV fimbrial biogenesis protein FimT
MRGKEGGVSLVELMVTVSMAVTLSVIAVPAFTNLKIRSERKAMVNALMTDLAHARSASINRGKRVVVCPSEDQMYCDSDAGWTQGRIVFVDQNNSAERDEGEPLLYSGGALPGGWHLSGTGSFARYVSYHPLGRPLQRTGAFQAGSFRLCHEQAPDAFGSNSVVVSRAGRPRVTDWSPETCE